MDKRNSTRRGLVPSPRGRLGLPAESPKIRFNSVIIQGCTGEGYSPFVCHDISVGSWVCVSLEEFLTCVLSALSSVITLSYSEGSFWVCWRLLTCNHMIANQQSLVPAPSSCLGLRYWPVGFPHIHPLAQVCGARLFCFFGGNPWNSIQPTLILSFST
jgi:hypothetical protein